MLASAVIAWKSMEVMRSSPVQLPAGNVIASHMSRTVMTMNEDEKVTGDVVPLRLKHDWGPSMVGHGEMQCKRCFVTNREAWVLGEYCLPPIKQASPK